MLNGVRILSLAEQYPGPYATLVLADLGADVILVERPDGGDPSRIFPAFFDALNRNKRSVVLDLKSDDGREALLRLAATADVILEGYRPGVAARLGVDYAALRELYPRIVYVSISGFGQDGPYSARPGHDVNYQALAGMLYEHAGGAAGAAPTIQVGDLGAGVFALAGVLLGLLHRERTGRGLYVDVSMHDVLVSMMTVALVPVLNSTGPPGFEHEPAYRLYRTEDQQVLALGISHEDRFWQALCDVVGLADARELRHDERLARADELVAQLEQVFATRSRDEWVRLLSAADVPVAPVYGLREVASDEHLAHRGMLVQVPSADGSHRSIHVRQPLHIDGLDPPRRPSPSLGEHTCEILDGLDRRGPDSCGPSSP